MSGPLSLVLAELDRGTPTLAGVAARTGLDDSLVRAVVDHLVRSGQVTVTELSTGCPPAGCGGCPVSAGAGRPGCGPAVAVPGRRAGLVALSLVRR